MKNKPTVGQRIFSLNIGNAARRTPQTLTPVVVKSVGRKYFTCGPEGKSDWMDSKYMLSDWGQYNGGYSPDSKLYESEQEWKDETEALDTIELIRKAFAWIRPDMISLDAIRKIKSALVESGKL